MFQAKRNRCDSNLRVTLRDFGQPRSDCASVCGDGILASNERCDDGPHPNAPPPFDDPTLDGYAEDNNAGAWGKCGADCRARGPFFGDGEVHEGEECDDGVNDSSYKGCGANKEGPAVSMQAEAAQDALEMIAGGSMRPLFAFDFSFDAPRSFQMRVHVVHGGATVVGKVTYAAQLAAPLGGVTWLEQEKVFSKSRFTGDDGASQKLNADKQLIQLVNDFVRSSYRKGQVTAPRAVRMDPKEGGALLSVSTLPRDAFLGVRFNPLVFVDIARRIEHVLGA